MDARKDYIAFCRYDGSGHYTVLSEDPAIQHPFAMSLFENYVYWTDWTKQRVVRAEKLHGGNVTVLHTHASFRFMDIHTVHPLRQPPGSILTSIFSLLYRYKNKLFDNQNQGADQKNLR